MTIWPDLLRKTSLRRQLTAVTAAGILGLALFSSLAISWQSAGRVRSTLIEQGQQAAANLARQSRLALIYDAADNVTEAVNLTMAFPGIVGLEIRHADGRLLLARGRPLDRPPAAAANAGHLLADSILEGESNDNWFFLAPVADAGLDSPFDVQARPADQLGYVRIVQSKETLQRMRNDVFLVNFAVSFVLAMVVLVLIHVLTSRLTRPLLRLSDTMGRADAGATGLLANEDGPREIATMARAFNKMMSVLADGEQQLRDARDQAIELARTKAEFAATVSHEIRTPLNGVIGTLDMLKVADMPAEQRHLLDQAWNSSLYLLDLINDILDLSRLEAGKLACEDIGFDLVAAIEDVVALLSPQAAIKDLDFGYFIADGVPARVRGDPRRLRQILVNLAGNAIKFTERGAVSLHAAPSENGSGRLAGLRFEVVDTGIGIAEDVQNAIFEWFTQADASTTRRFGGSGLGLAICKRLVGLLGGRIGVHSGPGQGSCFWFEVPLVAADSQPWPDAPPWPGRHALIGENSPLARCYLTQALGRWGLSIRCANDAATLEAMAAEAPAIDVILLTSSWVPAGSDLPSRLRRCCPDVGLLLTRSRPAFGTHETWADAELAKPFRLAPLRQAVARAMRTAGASNADVAATHEAHSGAIACKEFAGRRVLVVEDDRTSQEVVAGMLSMLGIDASVAADGLQGLSAMRRECWDAVLLDCSMPGMDGYQVAAAIRAEQATGTVRLPIIALTAHVSEAELDRCLSAGMDDYLAKPITLERLQPKLRQWLPRRAEVIGSGQDMPMHDTATGCPVLDMASFARLRAALGDSLDAAIQAFVTDIPIYLDKVDLGVAAGDWPRVRDVAHSIRGAAGNLGARALATLAGRMESTTADPEILRRLASEARTAFLAACQALGATRHGVRPAASPAPDPAAKPR
jgi:signal transduction histidine kinase/CheY-like chemotaxis protein/HPt (histidine-containing phosphotransfer) domain-containing protein